MVPACVAVQSRDAIQVPANELSIHREKCRVFASSLFDQCVVGPHVIHWDVICGGIAVVRVHARKSRGSHLRVFRDD